ncbi:chaperone modulator CbpM [Dichotomicrobium thermohalophilum]|uniref:Chaperone modulatory protein CbpM n=1 Tax=Dichotomicrobium thermohalophilum TaxID=933063 RepID=A0A397QEW6_9HYPH|nr:chaperone modulator CbpM [Dichotomicrobium thermohalophilum]RIA56831.1 chaperone modulatory protein CbpM [Dichotomicrobium thermohalophilum]
MRGIREVILEVEGVSETDLRVWIEYGWIRPARSEEDYTFTEVDIARVSLIADLRQRMGINDEAVPVVLDLMDQIYGLRRELRRVLDVVDRQPEPERSRILQALQEHASDDELG